ncbi:hypothetical protein TNCT_617271 [Trichonephila clavata]|uniref:Uncharacterized protein n=1 Tax=Trichonephila clavata TaxID=2740835 RepID=A0A8X6KBN4_TRICU|nr:hypothetical protein TNCT_617271 [Trichonephila clavata]
MRISPWGTENHRSWKCRNVFLDRGTNSEQDDMQNFSPILSSLAHYNHFQQSKKTFSCSITLRVVGSCSSLVGAQKLRENLLKMPSKLRPYSIVMNSYALNQKIQSSNSFLATVSVFWSGTRNASGPQENQS